MHFLNLIEKMICNRQKWSSCPSFILIKSYIWMSRMRWTLLLHFENNISIQKQPEVWIVQVWYVLWCYCCRSPKVVRVYFARSTQFKRITCMFVVNISIIFSWNTYFPGMAAKTTFNWTPNAECCMHNEFSENIGTNKTMNANSWSS